MPRWFRNTAIALLVVSIVETIAGAVRSPRDAAVGFLVTYVAVLSVVLGVLAMTMIAHLTTATWFRAFRPHAIRVIRVLPLLAGLGLLLLLALPVLFPWAAEASAGDIGRYLNVPFFIVRFVVYWTAWLWIAGALGAADRIAAAGDVARATERYRRVSVVGLMVLGLTMTFASFDWMMSLTPDWSSTIYGVVWFAGGMVGALALLAILAWKDGTRQAFSRISADDLDSLGKLLLTFILFWLYTAFAQYVVIWSGGLPREVAWYVARTRGHWGGVAVALLFAGFVFPFLLLLVREARRSFAVAAMLGVVLLAVHYLDTLWIVMPGVSSTSWWTLVLAIATLVIVLVAVARWAGGTVEQRNGGAVERTSGD
ncbi:MAG TPA: hypothetical protein VH559_03175 [Gemmatimonadaceae bacterium]|jgi:hypothetical protein